MRSRVRLIRPRSACRRAWRRAHAGGRRSHGAARACRHRTSSSMRSSASPASAQRSGHSSAASRSRSRTRRASSPPASSRWQPRSGAEALLLPVDSEHSAVFQCLEGRAADSVDSLVLTASGGPFRGRTRAELATVGVEDALAHPTWSMGPKITVDSATLANKGLELIEAHFLFGVPYEQHRSRRAPELDRPFACSVS